MKDGRFYEISKRLESGVRVQECMHAERQTERCQVFRRQDIDTAVGTSTVLEMKVGIFSFSLRPVDSDPGMTRGMAPQSVQRRDEGGVLQ